MDCAICFTYVIPFSFQNDLEMWLLLSPFCTKKSKFNFRNIQCQKDGKWWDSKLRSGPINEKARIFPVNHTICHLWLNPRCYLSINIIIILIPTLKFYVLKNHPNYKLISHPESDIFLVKWNKRIHFPDVPKFYI